MYLPNCQRNLVIALDTLSLLFCIFINTTAYQLGRYEPSPPSTKELHGYSVTQKVKGKMHSSIFPFGRKSKVLQQLTTTTTTTTSTLTSTLTLQ